MGLEGTYPLHSITAAHSILHSLAAQYRFGARSGGSVIILGLLEVPLGIFFVVSVQSANGLSIFLPLRHDLRFLNGAIGYRKNYQRAKKAVRIPSS
jgi:hypothetical protein